MDCDVTPTIKTATASNALKEERPPLTPEQRSARHRPPGTMVWRERFKTLQVPSWVPSDVQWLVSHYWGEQSLSPQKVDVVQRLLTDPRMETVWQELLQKRRPTGEHFYLLDNLKGVLGSARANEMFPASTIMVFQRAVVVGVSVLRIHEQKSLYYFEQAHGRRGDADFLRRMVKERRLGNVSTKDIQRLAGQLDEAVEAYERLSQLAGLKFAGSRLFDNSQFAAKGFAITMAKTMQGLYGTPMCGTIATLARVALGNDEITPAAVRKWCTP